MAITGCTPGTITPADPTPTVTISPTPPDPVAAAEQAVLAAYEGMWAAYDQAGQAPEADPDHPDLERFATGTALQALVDALTALRDEGLVFEGEVVLSPEVVEMVPHSSPPEASVEDCADSANWVRARHDGRHLDDEPGGKRRVVAELEEGGDGAWRVVEFAVLEVGSCP